MPPPHMFQIKKGYMRTMQTVSYAYCNPKSGQSNNEEIIKYLFAHFPPCLINE